MDDWKCDWSKWWHDYELVMNFHFMTPWVITFSTWQPKNDKVFDKAIGKCPT